MIQQRTIKNRQTGRRRQNSFCLISRWVIAEVLFSQSGQTDRSIRVSCLTSHSKLLVAMYDRLIIHLRLRQENSQVRNKLLFISSCYLANKITILNQVNGIHSWKRIYFCLVRVFRASDWPKMFHSAMKAFVCEKKIQALSAVTTL